MKKISCIILCLTLLFSAYCGTVYAGTSTVKPLLNSVSLKPMKTGYEPLDSMVDEVINKYTNSGMTTYEKVVALYDFCSKTFDYQVPFLFLNDELYYSYLSELDAMIIEFADYILETGVGVCDNFAALFMVLTRALGLESYYVGGQVKNGNSYSGHSWNVIRLNNQYYIFDTQVENKYYKQDGKMRYSWFGNAVSASPGYVCPDMNDYISDFKSFEQVNVNLTFLGCNPDIPLLPGEKIEFHITDVNSNINVYDFYYVCRYGELETDALDNLTEDELTAISGKNFSLEPTKKGIWTLFVLIETERGYLIDVEHYKVLGENEYTLMAGDINIDGRVTAADARLALRAAVKLETIEPDDIKFCLFDVNGDGILSADDARLILRASVSLEELPPLKTR